MELAIKESLKNDELAKAASEPAPAPKAPTSAVDDLLNLDMVAAPRAQPPASQNSFDPWGTSGRLGQHFWYF